MTGPQKEAYTYNQSDELLGVNGDHSDSFTFSYDKNGNVIEETGKQGNDSKNREESGKQGWRYTYDDENRLIVAEQKINNKVVSKVSYSYDPFGRRIQKKSYTPTESPFASTDHSCEKGSSIFPLALHEKTEQYLYDGEDIIAIYDANGNIQMSFVHGPGVDEPLSVTYYKKQNPKKDKAEKETNYYTADALGSIVRITDEKGHIVESYAYDTFGNFRDSGNDRNDSDLHSDRGWGDGHDNNYDSKTEIQQPYAYTGREYDEETGLYYYRARYYDPSVGRFISKDPVIGFVVSPQTLNRYGYVTNNPVRYVDPSGLSKADVSLIDTIYKNGSLQAGGCFLVFIGGCMTFSASSEGFYFTAAGGFGIGAGVSGSANVGDGAPPSEGWSTNAGGTLAVGSVGVSGEISRDENGMLGQSLGVAPGGEAEVHVLESYTWRIEKW